MTFASPLDSAARWLNWSNGLYVTGAVLTVFSSMLVFYEKRQIEAGKRVRGFIATEFAVFFVAILSFVGTIGAIHFGKTVSRIKDADLAQYEVTAQVQIAEANTTAEIASRQAGIANQKAGEANQKAQNTAKANAKLRIEVARQEVAAQKSATELAAQTEKVNRFAQGVAQQQQGMAQQMQTFPSLGQAQIADVARQLRPYGGQKVSIHMMMDAHAQRLAVELQQAFKDAGIEVTSSSVDVGPVYQGVMIGVKAASPAPHPHLADSLINSLRSVGVLAVGRAFPTMKEDEVAIYIGPN